MLASNDKIYAIANQDVAGLMEHAGSAVTLVGTIQGETITVRTVEPLGAVSSEPSRQSP